MDRLFKGVGEYVFRFGGMGSQYKMLLIGETGSGKTSFLNLLCNSKLIEELGTSSDPKTLEKIRAYNDLKIENSSDRAMVSKTSDAQIYNTEVCKMKISVIDTPGFGDSRGLQQDKTNVAKIIEILKKQDSINCVCLVINGRNARMSASLKYVMSEISSILPKEVFNNIIVVFTNCADPLDCNFDMRELVTYFGKTDDRDFHIENPYCRIEKAQKSHLSSEKIFRSLRKSFVDTAECLRSMHQCIAKFEKVQTYHFINLFEKKQAIEKDVIILLGALDEQEQLAKSIKSKEEEVKAAFKTKNLHHDFKTTKIVKVWKPIETPDKRHNTLCGAPGCYSNCHMPCHLEKSYEQETFKSCAAMGGTETCKKCSHSYKVHYHNELYFKQIEERQEIIDEDMKAKFQEAVSMEERAQILYDGMKREQDRLLQKKRELAQQLKSKMSEFQYLGISQINYAKLLEQQRDVIEIRIQSTTGPESHQLRDLKSDIEKRLTVVYDAIKQK